MFGEIMAAVGLASSVFGMFGAQEEAKKKAEYQRQYDQYQLQVYQQQLQTYNENMAIRDSNMAKKQEAQTFYKQAYALQVSQDETRQQGASLDANRRKREIVRQALTGRSVALGTAVRQGVSTSDSAVKAATGQAMAQGATNAVGVDQQLQLGQDLFNLKKQEGAAYLQASNILSTVQEYKPNAPTSPFPSYIGDNTGSGLMSFGSSLLGSSDKVGKLGDFAYSGLTSYFSGGLFR